MRSDPSAYMETLRQVILPLFSPALCTNSPYTARRPEITVTNLHGTATFVASTAQAIFGEAQGIIPIGSVHKGL